MRSTFLPALLLVLAACDETKIIYVPVPTEEPSSSESGDASSSDEVSSTTAGEPTPYGACEDSAERWPEFVGEPDCTCVLGTCSYDCTEDADCGDNGLCFDGWCYQLCDSTDRTHPSSGPCPSWQQECVLPIGPVKPGITPYVCRW